MAKAVYRLEDGTEYRLLRKWEAKTSPLTTEQKREARAFRVGRFRQTKCSVTGKPIVLSMLHDAYDLHHLLPQGSPGYNMLPNMRLALHGPNANAGKPPRPGIERKDKDRIPISETDLLRQRVDYSSGSREMQVNADAEPEFRGWVFDQLWYGERNDFTKREAIFGGAEKVGVSPQATRDYLAKMTSSEGPLREVKEDGIKLIKVKPGRLE